MITQTTIKSFGFISKLAIIAFLITVPSIVKAQTTEMQGTVKIKDTHKVIKLITVKDCPETHTPPTATTGTVENEITFETKYTNGKTEITSKDIVKPASGSTVTFGVNKVIRKAMTPVDGKATLYTDDKDKTILYVNYFLNPSYTLPTGTQIQEFTVVHDCASVPTITPKTARTLAAPETFTMWRVNPGTPEMTTEWFLNSDHIVVKTAAGALDYYLVNRYDRSGKYVLELKNRESISYNSSSLDLGAITIPIKYRFGFKKNGIKIHDDATASFNIGAFLGYKITKYSVINKEGTYTNRNHTSLRTGIFMNVGTTTIDSTSTSVGRVPITDPAIKYNIATISTGGALMAEIKGLQIGVFGGWDFGVGTEAANWNYHKRFWLGFGFGYKLTDLFAKS